jgi:hypothetical protein
MVMRDEQLRYGFFQHRGLIAFATGGAVAEAVLLTIVAPGSRPLSPQATALAPIAAYHDVRWLFAGQQSALLFGLTAVAVLIARSAIDAVLLRLAWPRAVPGDDGQGPALPARPTMRVAFLSCAGLTVLAWLMQAPAVTLTFGVAVLPFSWPFLAAFPLVLCIATLLSHGGIAPRWWRRLPSAACVGWALASFVMLSLFAAVTAHLAATGAIAATAVAGMVNARAWYGIGGAAGWRPPLVPDPAPLWRSFGRVLWWVPVAPLAAILVVVGAVGLVRLIFTGTIQIPQSNSVKVASVSDGTAITPPSAVSQVAGAVLVVAGFGSSCCSDLGDLRQIDPGMDVRQFSYAGMTAAGRPLPQSGQADDVPLPLLGDRMATQLLRLHDQTRRPVDIVAESEGTLGLYAMLARHPRLPIGSVVLLSPIIAPGQYGSDSGNAVPQVAINELNRLIGRMSPYGSSGAGQLIDSAAAVGAGYFDDVTRDHRMRYLVIVPLADATTMPDCALPSSVIVVPDFHGGLLGDPRVQVTVGRFLARLPIHDDSNRLREAAEAITGAASAWRMPVTHPLCP